jgi:hypothetical protein
MTPEHLDIPMTFSAISLVYTDGINKLHIMTKKYIKEVGLQIIAKVDSNFNLLKSENCLFHAFFQILNMKKK